MSVHVTLHRGGTRAVGGEAKVAQPAAEIGGYAPDFLIQRISITALERTAGSSIASYPQPVGNVL